MNQALPKKTALITGISGQDGAYLTRLLLDKGYAVVGLTSPGRKSQLDKLRYLGVDTKIKLLACDLQNFIEVNDILKNLQPDEIYNLAAQSSVGASFKHPIETIQFNINSVVNILEAMRKLDSASRFYQASTSEMFGRIEELPITEESKFHPLSPYAISKVAAHHITINYRESYNLFACCGILFNHESFLRGNGFFTKKVIRTAIEIKHGKKDKIELGNLDIKRDFGFSEKYVEAMWLMLQQDEPEDYIIASGRSVCLRDVVNYVFDKLEIDKSKILTNKELLRPTDIEDIYGSSEKARKKLNWKYDMDFFSVLDKIIEEEERNYEP